MSHNGEEKTIGRLLGNPTSPGLYLDIGANHPATSSNTWSFYQAGWSGLAVDPLPGLAELWSQMRPRDRFVSCAVGAAPGSGRLEENNECSLMREGPGAIQICTMDQLLADWGKSDIEFASVDVETWEEQVFRGWDMHRWRPKVLCVESIFPCTAIQIYDQWEHLLFASGYAFAEADSANRYYLAG